MPVLKIFIIHTSALSIRMQKLEPIIQVLKKSAQNANYRVEIVLIISSDPTSLHSQLEELQKKVSYDKTGNPFFDQCIQVLSLEMISNIEKHKEALKKIVNNKYSSDDDLYLIIEDDTVILKDCIQNFEDILTLDHKNHEWDIIILGLSKSVNPKDKQDLESLNELNASGKILPSKEAYFIRKNIATKVLSEFENYKFTYRIQLSWIINTGGTGGTGGTEGTGSGLKVYYPRKRTTIDGSKLGLFTSSIHSNNILTYNNEYMQLYKYLTLSKEEIEKNMPAITDLYKSVKNLNSCDFTHLYGLLKIKVDMLKEGEELLLEAIEQVKQSQGLLNSRSDLANNLIELYQHLQNDIPKIATAAVSSRYKDVVFRNSDGILL